MSKTFWVSENCKEKQKMFLFALMYNVKVIFYIFVYVE